MNHVYVVFHHFQKPFGRRSHQGCPRTGFFRTDRRMRLGYAISVWLGWCDG